MNNADYEDSLVKTNYMESQSSVPTSLALLKAYGKKMKRLNPENIIQKSSETERKNTTIQAVSISAQTIMKLGRERLVELNSQKSDIFSILSGKQGTKSNLMSKDIEDTDLGLLLQAAAQLVSNKKFVSARTLLNKCELSASKNGSPIQRIVYYFAKALQERIDVEWGLIPEHSFNTNRKDPIDVILSMTSLQPSLMECQQDLPGFVIIQFTSIQTLLDNVASAKRVHIIDLSINNGSHWIILMQALASRGVYTPLNYLKITAIGTSKEIMDDTGERLTFFARDMNLPFHFNVLISELKGIKEDMFKLEDDEVVAISSSVSLWSLLQCPNHLESLLQVLKKLNPCVMVLDEIDASLNSPKFIERFTESLLYFSAVFDSLYVTLKNHPFRKMCEEVLLYDMLSNIIISEGRDRSQRQEKVTVWRDILGKFGIVEIDLSKDALSQARLLHKNYAYERYMTLDMDGKCLIIGWEGTPLQFLSAWKFL